MTSVVLDNQAVQALLDVRHPSHRLVLAHVDEANRSSYRRRRVHVLVPTPVRVEAGWDRDAPTASNANRLVRQDVVLDGHLADVATRLRERTRVSVVDAAVAAVVGEAEPPVVILTSDLDDMRRLLTSSRSVRLVRV